MRRRRPFPVVQPQLGHFQVVVGQIAPEESSRLALGGGVVVLPEQRRRALDQLLRARQDPAVGRRQVAAGGERGAGCIIGQETLAEAGHVPQLGDQLVRPSGSCLSLMTASLPRPVLAAQ